MENSIYNQLNRGDLRIAVYIFHNGRRVSKAAFASIYSFPDKIEGLNQRMSDRMEHMWEGGASQ